MPTAPRPSSPARSSSARASSPRSRQIAAEELDLPLARITMISGDTGQTPNEGQTAGSQSVENSGTALRMAGAEVRAILLDLAAKQLGVARRSARGRRWRDHGAGRPQGQLRRTGGERRSQSRSERRRRRRSRRRATRSSANRSRASTSRRRSRAARPTCRTSACPEWCTAAWCVRRAMARSSTASTRPP